MACCGNTYLHYLHSVVGLRVVDHVCPGSEGLLNTLPWGERCRWSALCWSNFKCLQESIHSVSYCFVVSSDHTLVNRCVIYLCGRLIFKIHIYIITSFPFAGLEVWLPLVCMKNVRSSSSLTVCPAINSPSLKSAFLSHVGRTNMLRCSFMFLEDT